MFELQTSDWRSPGIYPILDWDFCEKKNLDFYSVPELWLPCSDVVPFFQIRAKTLTESEIARSLETLRTRYPKARWILNDHWSLAIRSDCFGAHVGKEDFERLTETEKNELARSGLFLGTSAHTLEEVLSLDPTLWKYVGLGPVFETENKEDAKSAIGTEILKTVARAAPIRVTLIGGIQVSKLDSILDQGPFLLSGISMACLESEFRSAVRKIRTRNS
ncbi:thiamine phosphate synthase [Leptospira gomenensis]|uniref:Thiamine phosphate synthase n=1 Tax=Leptospira gomenensis TaxID=2484974 RepID=A0A5F1YDW7_9LEPT|nr:thiamine phosphate synthase [Leptospira gomenensis]TGK35492.1 thiamine phosphate synthase [Leptospira gomenensis]TGK40616.1 thiamine phosphate synthase [Leptospira gomenensis]TGK46294.1 thiamine phosphate synthase [Leptospira gomenensis]TGK66429.1 thiamine phosphate synthase [Leptospira gomenensis]